MQRHAFEYVQYESTVQIGKTPLFAKSKIINLSGDFDKLLPLMKPNDFH